VKAWPVTPMLVGLKSHVYRAGGGQQVDRRVSVGRSRLILYWTDKIPKKKVFQSVFLLLHYMAFCTCDFITDRWVASYQEIF